MRESKLTMNKKNREIRKMDVWMDGQIDRQGNYVMALHMKQS